MDDENGSGLPASLQSAWGMATRPAKGPKPTLSLDRIVASAIGIADAEGLAAVSMSKVAADVGATAMALYRYVGNKDELLALMVDEGLGPPPEVPHPGQGWRAGLTEWAWGAYLAYRKHPWALRVPISGIPALPNQFGWMDRGLRCLIDSGLDAEDQLSVILLISNLSRVYMTIETDFVIASQSSGRSPDEVVADFGKRFKLLATPDRFPALNAAIATGVLDKADPVDKEFIFGLNSVLDGLEVLISRTRPPG